jgi:hypothetical protein
MHFCNINKIVLICKTKALEISPELLFCRPRRRGANAWPIKLIAIVYEVKVLVD